MDVSLSCLFVRQIKIFNSALTLRYMLVRPMMKAINLLVCLCGLLFSLSASATLSEQQITELAERVIAAKNARQQPNSTTDDVERFIALFADDFVDEHVKFNVTVTSKAELRKGMLAKLQDKILFSNIEITELMTGRNVAFIKFIEHAKGQPAHLDKPIEYTAVNIWSVEFNDAGQIVHLRRHHGL